MTTRDVLVQLGFLMVTAGAMLLAWAVFTGQFFRLRRKDGREEEEEGQQPRSRRGGRSRPA